MKKIIALVLVLVLALAAVNAFAEASKGNDDIAGGRADGGFTLTKIDPTPDLQEIIDAVTAAVEEGQPAVKGLPEDVAAGIPEDRETINEMDCYQLSGDFTKTKDIELVFKFETPYDPEKDPEVTLLIAIDVPEEGEVEWLSLDGKVNADGDVVVKVTKEQLELISDNPFMVIPVSK